MWSPFKNLKESLPPRISLFPKVREALILLSNLRRGEKAINEIEVGNKSPEETVNYFPRGKVRRSYVDMLETEWFDLASERRGYEPDSNGFYSEHIPSKRNTVLPYQGYKLRITATPKEARSVAKAVLKPLRSMGEFHKVVENIEKLQRMKGDSQKGKFITVYPEVSETQVLEGGSQRFH